MAPKTRHYMAVLYDGTVVTGVWGGDTRSWRIHLETDYGVIPVAVFVKQNPLWTARDSIVQTLKQRKTKT